MPEPKAKRCWLCGHQPRIDDDGSYTRYSKVCTMVSCSQLFCPNENRWKKLDEWNAEPRLESIILAAKEEETRSRLRHELWKAEEFLKEMGFNEWADRKKVLDYCEKHGKTVYQVSKTAILHYFPS